MDNLFFIASKLAWGLLSPTNLLILLFSLGTLLLVFNRIRLAKWLLIPTVIISLALLVYPFSDMVIYPLESRFDKPSELPQNIDGIIVLGGGEELKQSISWNNTELGSAGDRYIAATILAKQYADVPIIFSGGSGLLRTTTIDNESNIARSLLLALGVEQQQLIIEGNSRNTYENFTLIAPLLPNRHGQYLLVTSAFHMPRAVGIARQNMINVIPYPVDYRSSMPLHRQWDFNLFEHLEVLEPAWREWIGLTVYYWTGKTSEWLPAP